MPVEEFTNDSVKAYINCFGFSSINDKAIIQLILIVETLVFNILDNMFFVVDSMKSPALTKKHMAAVINLMRHKKTQAGGSYTVLPSEYFGIDSGRYVADVSQMETNMNVADFTRPAMHIKGGANEKCMVADANLIEAIIKHYKTSKNVKFTAGKDVVDMIMASVNLNIDDLMSAAMHSCKGKKKSKLEVTISLINSTIKSHSDTLKHLVVSHKKKSS